MMAGFILRVLLRARLALCRYETVRREADAMQRPYTALAALLNCRPEEIAIVTSATVAWQQVTAAGGVAFAGTIRFESIRRTRLLA